MKMAFYISSLSGGGAEKVLTTLANRFSEDGNEVHVISLEKREQFYEFNDKITVHKKCKNEKLKLVEFVCDLLFIRKCFKRIRADVSISFLSRCNLGSILVNLFNKEKIVVCDRNNPLKEHSRITFRFSNLLYLRANKVIVQTKQIKKFYNKSLQHKIDVIENPIDELELYKQVNSRQIDKCNTIISIGRLENQKDFNTLIKAFAKIAYKFSDWKLKIFGIGEMLHELIDLVNQLNLSDQVQFCGRTKQPFYELSCSKIFVLSTRYEGFPNVLCEAMEAGLLCISSDCISGPRELIYHGKNGFLFPIGDSDTLAELMEKCINYNDNNIGEAAKKTVTRLHLEENIKVWKKMIEGI